MSLQKTGGNSKSVTGPNYGQLGAGQRRAINEKPRSGRAQPKQ
jgi:hypothetical protein